MAARQDDILADIAGMLHAILEGFSDDTDITMDSSFRDDLEMESIDIVSLAGRLQARYGDSVNFAQFVAGLDLASVRSLRVGQLVDHIVASLAGTRPPATVPGGAPPAGRVPRGTGLPAGTTAVGP